MCAAALQQVQLDAADLGAGFLLQDVGQHGGGAAQLGVTEAVGGRGLGLGHEGAVGVVDALGHGDEAVVALGIDALDVGDELVHVEVGLGHVDQVGAAAVFAGQGGGGGEPAGVTAHDLHHGDHAGVIHPGVLVDLHDGGGDILGSAGVAGAVVGAPQVVVDGLGYAHHAALITHGLHVLADLVAGVHGVVAAVIEEVADVVLLEDLQDALVIGVVLLGVGNLIAAGAQGRGGGVLHQPQLLGVLQTHVKQPVVQHALDAVLCAQHLGDAAGFQRGVNDAVGAGVDDGSGAAGLADDAGAFQFVHINYLHIVYHIKMTFARTANILSWKNPLVKVVCPCKTKKI